MSGCFLLQGIFQTQGSSPHLLCLLHGRAGSLGAVHYKTWRHEHAWCVVLSGQKRQHLAQGPGVKARAGDALREASEMLRGKMLRFQTFIFQVSIFQHVSQNANSMSCSEKKKNKKNNQSSTELRKCCSEESPFRDS